MVTPSARCTLPLTVAPGYTLTKSPSTESWPIVEFTWSWVCRPSVMLVVTLAPAARMQPSAIRLSLPTVAIGCTSTIGAMPAAVSRASRSRRTAPAPIPITNPVTPGGLTPRVIVRSIGPRYATPRRASRWAFVSLSSTVPSSSNSAPAAFIASTMSSTSRPKPPAPTTISLPAAEAASASAGEDDDTGARVLLHLRSAP